MNAPTISIGLPVYNGEDFIAKSINSLLAQTFRDFELIICDNASTDNTGKICQAYAAQDSRVKYYRNPTNLGAPRNYNRTVTLSRGKYFKWAAADDVHAPEYLEKCVQILENDPSVVLCHTKMYQIDENGTIVGTYDHKMRLSSYKIEERFADQISLATNICFQMYGLMRKAVLIKTPLHGDYRGADGNFLAEMSLYGRLYEVPEYLFMRREHPKAYTQQFCHNKNSKTAKISDQQKAWWSNSSWINYTIWKNCYEFFKSVHRTPLKPKEKMVCYREIFRWFRREGWKLSGTDIEQHFLNRYSFGRTSVKVTKRVMRHIGIYIADEE
jgi:glycosyltransferase involved in cell wall biosynthesis